MIACASGKKEASTLEQTRGPLIYALLEYPFFVLYPVNPATTARYRQAFKTSRAKDDPSDAQICLELLLHHREKLPLAARGCADARTLLPLTTSPYGSRSAHSS